MCYSVEQIQERVIEKAGAKLLEDAKKPVPCKLCGKPTHGATGAAGIFWPFLCQPCKDAEDAAALSGLQAVAQLPFWSPRGMNPDAGDPEVMGELGIQRPT